MFRQSPASSDHNDSQTPPPGHGFADPDAMQVPSPAQPSSDNQALHSTNRMQEPVRTLSLLHRSFPVNQQPLNSAETRRFDPNILGVSLHHSLASNYVASYTPHLSLCVCCVSMPRWLSLTFETAPTHAGETW
jgi:hypothetical protein